MSEQVWQESPMNEGFTQKVKSLKFKIKSLNQTSSKSKTLIIQLSRSTTPSAHVFKTWQIWNTWSAQLHSIWWWRFGREVKSGSWDMPWSLAEKALFSSISGNLTQKTLAWGYKVFMERDFTAPRQPRYLAVAGGTKVMLEGCTAA